MVRSERSSRIESSLAADHIGVLAVVFNVVSSLAPALVAAGLIPVFFMVTGVQAVPFTMIVIVVILGLFSVGYLSTAKHVANAGAIYSYVVRGLGRPFGIGAAMMALGAYNLLQVALYGLFGVVAKGLVADTFHVDWPWWAWALVAWAAVAILGLRDIKLVAVLLGAAIIGEFLIIWSLSINGLATPAADADYLHALSPSGLTLSTGSVAGAVVVLCFVGFELAPAYREEAKHATRTIVTATVLTLSTAVLTYGVAAWSMIVHYGPGTVITHARELGDNPSAMLFGLATGWLSTVGPWFLLSSVFAAAVAFHTGVNRYTFVLGREGVLPRFFERINRSQAPRAASLLQSTFGLGVILLYATKHWDPTVKLFYWLGQTGGFLVLGLLVLCSIAVVNFLRRRDTSALRIIAPSIAGLALAALFVLVWKNYSPLLGEQTPSPASRLLPLLAVALLLIGLLWAGALRLWNPNRYFDVGRHEDQSSPGDEAYRRLYPVMPARDPRG